MSLATPTRRRWTRDEYHRMAELGWFAGQRVELVAGEVVEMSPQRDSHVISVALTVKHISAAFGAGFWVRVQAPLNLDRYDAPEPDIAVVPGAERDYIGSDNRGDARLLVEVSDTTLAFDRGRKARRYARAGIADYWILNLPDRRLEVHRNPRRQGRRYGYGSIAIIEAGEDISPLAAPYARVRVADLLP